MRPQPIPESNQVENWRTLKYLLPYLSEFKGRIFLAFIFLISAKLASIALPLIMGNIVDQMNANDQTPDTIDRIWIFIPATLVILYGLLRLLNVLFGEIRDTLFGRVTERAMRRVGYRVFKHLHKLDLDFHLNRKTGGLSRDIERGVSGISFLMRFMIFNILPTLLEIMLVIWIFYSQFGAKFALVTFASILAYISFSVLVTNWRNRFLRAANKADSESNSRAIDSLLNYETVKYYTNEEFEAKRYDDDLAKWERARRQNRLSLFALNSGQAFIISASMTVMMYLAALDVKNEILTAGNFVTINGLMMGIFIPLNFLGFVYREIKMSLINIEDMFKLLNVTPKIADSETAEPMQLTNGNIRFEAVDFSYVENRQILKNINFEVKSGETIALVGSSGSGKSTTIKMLFRFYDPSAGRILIDGQDIKEVTQHSLRKVIGIVPQETVLFNDTIFENIRYGRPNATQKEVLDAIKMAHLDDFITQLPEGTKTIVGERGLKLSGGEKQRVAIARTILKKPPILVFDEATSSLDSRSEKGILTSINELSKTTTSLIIAHRLSTIVNADKIIVFEKGAIVEQGNHAELLRLKQHYFELWQAQQKEPSVNE
ncbi:MAG: ABC transporter ATP-binding protein/permease [Kangiellaceae bacterium]|nr:ABC transporter ATP-binding protein/permease [Kangiellaceae bacterium]